MKNSSGKQVMFERLTRLPDTEIDLSDQPEILNWSNAERGKFYRPVKQVQREQERKVKAVKC